MPIIGADLLAHYHILPDCRTGHVLGNKTGLNSKSHEFRSTLHQSCYLLLRNSWHRTLSSHCWWFTSFLQTFYHQTRFEFTDGRLSRRTSAHPQRILYMVSPPTVSSQSEDATRLLSHLQRHATQIRCPSAPPHCENSKTICSLPWYREGLCTYRSE